MIFTSWRYTAGMRDSSAASGSGVRMPATTSSPWAFTRNSPKKRRSPLEGSRLNATPVPEVSPRLPNTMAITVTAVPQSSGEPVDAPVVHRLLREPRVEDGLDGQPQLLRGVLGKRARPSSPG